MKSRTKKGLLITAGVVAGVLCLAFLVVVVGSWYLRDAEPVAYIKSKLDLDGCTRSDAERAAGCAYIIGTAGSDGYIRVSVEITDWSKIISEKEQAERESRPVYLCWFSDNDYQDYYITRLLDDDLEIVISGSDFNFIDESSFRLAVDKILATLNDTRFGYAFVEEPVDCDTA